MYVFCWGGGVVDVEGVEGVVVVEKFGGCGRCWSSWGCVWGEEGVWVDDVEDVD